MGKPTKFHINSKEDLRVLVVEVARLLDELEYERKVIYGPHHIKAAALAVTRIEATDKGNGAVALDEAFEDLDSYKDIDLSSPDYEGMDDPL
jgi:hypothetical protein